MAADACAGGTGGVQVVPMRPSELGRLVWPDAFDWSGRHKPEEYLKSRVTALWEAREHGDFVLDVRGEVIRVHGCVLAAASPVFRAMLSNGMLESAQRMATIDADPEDVLVVIRFAYFGELIDVMPLQLPGVLQLAHAYEMVELIPLCCDHMIRHLNGDTAVPYVQTLRLLEDVPMDLTISMSNGTLPAAVSGDVNSARRESTTGSGNNLHGSPPEQPQQALFFQPPFQQPPFGLQPQQTSRIPLRPPILSSASWHPGPPSSGQAGHQPRQPAVSRQPQLLARFSAPGSAAAVPSGGPDSNGGGSTANADAAAADQGQSRNNGAAQEGAEAGAGTATDTAEDRGEACQLEASPIAHTFVTIASLIARSPELQMVTLRGL